MNDRTAYTTDEVKLQEAITKVGLLTYVGLILGRTELRNIVKPEVDRVMKGGLTSEEREKAVATVTDAMKDWGLPPDAIEQIRLGDLTAEINIYTAFPDPLPDQYGLSGCTAPQVRPALALLK